MCIVGIVIKLSALFGIFARTEAKIKEFVIFFVMLYISTEYIQITARYMEYEDKSNAFGSYLVSNCGSAWKGNSENISGSENGR